MSAVITSTTDTPEAVNAAMGKAVEKKPVVETKKPEVVKMAAETTEDSGASETETEELESIDSDIEAESDDQKNVDGQDKPKKKSGFQRKVNKLTKRAAEAEQRAKFWEAEALKAKAQETRPKAEAEKKPEVSLEGKPKQDDFATVAEYYEAIADWKFDQREKAKTAKEREDSNKSDYQKKIEAYHAKVEIFKKDHPEFNEVIEDLKESGFEPSFVLHDLIIDSENGPEIFDELAKNRKELDRINKLGIVAASREIGKIEARIEKQSVTDAITGKTTKAPPPLTPVSSKKVSPAKNPDEMSYQEYKKWHAETHRRA